MQADPATMEPFKNVRREVLVCIIPLRIEQRFQQAHSNLSSAMWSTRSLDSTYIVVVKRVCLFRACGAPDVRNRKTRFWADGRPAGSYPPARPPLHLIHQVTLCRLGTCPYAQKRRQQISPHAYPGTYPVPSGPVAIKKPCVCRSGSGIENPQVQSQCRAFNKLIFLS